MEVAAVVPNFLSVIPFASLLILIATGPLLVKKPRENFYEIVSVILAAITVIYYVVWLNDGSSIIHAFAEYVSFILLLTSLYVVTGGIIIRFAGEGSSRSNVFFLFIGTLIANIIGTTGASMLLIRPFLRLNKTRIRPLHIVFFIFLVSNVGGALTPIGDPPLFLGFLRGIPFFWVLCHVWYIWLTAVVLLLGIFWWQDRRYDAGVKAVSVITLLRSIRIEGSRNFLFLGVILCSMFLDHSSSAVMPVIQPIGLREIILLLVTIIAYSYTPEEIYQANEFDFGPMKEVAFLFAGLFITMVPALQIISAESYRFGARLNPTAFFWGSGMLSSILDNAPTYLNFLSGAMGKFGLNSNSVQQVGQFLGFGASYIIAISIACVFFGAMTYIGNGPNFMVKAVSEKAGMKMPSFFGYIKGYSVPVLLPVFLIIWFLFLR